MAGRPTDEQRVMRFLADSDGMSNPSIRTELNLSDGRYEEIKRDLLEQGYIEKYRCYGGGIRLTLIGEKNVPIEEDPVASTVQRERDLYKPLIDFLVKQSKEDEVSSIPINTADLRNKGKWQNPDVTQVHIERYRYLSKVDIVLRTYEVKQWGRWDTSAVFEAASHKRFAHQSIVVLEWPSGPEFSLTDRTYKLDQVARECRRFGVGLYTLRPYYSAYRLHPHLAAVTHSPKDTEVDKWMDYMFKRRPKALAQFEELRSEKL